MRRPPATSRCFPSSTDVLTERHAVREGRRRLRAASAARAALSRSPSSPRPRPTRTSSARRSTSIVDEEPTLLLTRDEETHQTVLYALGDTGDRRRAIAKLKDRFHVEAEIVELRIPYRETIRKTATAQGRHKKQTGGSGQFADCWLRVEPNPGGGYEFIDEIVGGKISKPFIVAIDKGVQDTHGSGRARRLPGGRREGRRVRRLAARGRLATRWRSGWPRASASAPLPSRPTWSSSSRSPRSRSTCPTQYAGAVMGDMSSSRGRILGMDSVDGMQRHPRAGPLRRGRALLAAPALDHAAAPARTRSRSASTSRCPHDMAEEARRDVPEGEGRGALDASCDDRTHARPAPARRGRPRWLFWCPLQDSNLRPSAPEADALSAELRRRVARKRTLSYPQARRQHGPPAAMLCVSADDRETG